MYLPIGIWGNTLGDIFFTDQQNKRLRVVSAFSGLVNSIAGNSGPTFTYTGAALALALISPTHVHGDANGRLYVSDADSFSVIRGLYISTQLPTTAPTTGPTLTMSPSATPTTSSPSVCPSTVPSSAPAVPVYQLYTVAGNGDESVAVDVVVALSTPLSQPTGILVESTSNLLHFADKGNSRVRTVNMNSGIMTVFAGTILGNSGNGGQASNAKLNKPFGVIMGTTSGVILISDTEGHSVRQVAVNGIITAYAGTGLQSTAITAANGDLGPATSATFCNPNHMALVGANLYVAEYGAHKIRRINTLNGIIVTAMGNGQPLSAGNGGPVSSATLYAPSGLFADSNGKLYVTEYSGYHIRSIGLLTGNIVSLFAGQFFCDG